MIKIIAASVLALTSLCSFAVEQKIAGGSSHTLFIEKGNVYGMGSNAEGELNTSAFSNTLVPVFLGYTSAKSVAGTPFRSAILKYDGTVELSGRKAFSSPIKVKAKYVLPASNVTDIAMTYTEFYFVSNGVLYKWTFSDTQAPVAISNSAQKVISVAAGVNHIVVLYEDMTVATLGTNTFGQLGNNSNKAATTLVKLPLTNVVQIAAGMNRSFFLLSDGSVYGTGQNTGGELGIPDKVNKNAPAKIANISNVKKIVTGSLGTTALTNTGEIYVTGWHNYIQTDIYNVSYSFSKLTGIYGVADISQPSDNTFVSQNVDGLLSSWGGNNAGRLGDGTVMERHFITQARFTSLPSSLPVAEIPAMCSSMNPNGKIIYKDAYACKVIVFNNFGQCKKALREDGYSEDDAFKMCRVLTKE